MSTSQYAQWPFQSTATGTVTSVGLQASPISVFNVTNSPITTSGDIGLALKNQNANLVLAGPTSGGAAAPAFRALVSGDIPSLSGIYLPLAGGTMSGNIAMGANSVTGIATLVSNTANPASVGILRLANTDAISWRNSTNSYDVSLAFGAGATLTYSGAPSTVGQEFRVQNSNNTAGSNALASFSVAGSSAGDPFIVFDTTAVVDWAVGSDTSDSSKFKISKNGTLGTNDYLVIDLSGNTTLAGSLTLGTALTVANGGTGDATLTAYSVLCGGTTSTGAVQSVSGLGTSGWVLTSNGAAALPTWQAVPAGGVTTLAAVGSSPNSNAGTISGSTLTLQPADGTNPGLWTALAQTLAGAKTFTGVHTMSAGAVGAPSINFGDATTGFYKDATNSIAVANNGVIGAEFPAASHVNMRVNRESGNSTQPVIVTSGSDSYGIFMTASGAQVGLNGSTQSGLYGNTSNTHLLASIQIQGNINQNTDWMIGGTFKSVIAPVSNGADSSEDNLMTYTLASVNSVNNGDRIEIVAWGTFAANATSKTVKLYFGSTVVGTIGSLATVSGGSWRIDGEVVRTGAATQVANFRLSVDSTNATGFPTQCQYTTPTQTLSSSMVIKCTGQGTAAADVTQVYMKVNYGSNGN